MRWSKLNWFNIIKQLFMLGLGYCLLRMGVIMLNYYGIPGKAHLPRPGEIAVLIMAGRLFEIMYSRLTVPIQRRLAFFSCILVLTLFGLIPATLFEFDISGFMRLVSVYLSFVYGASVNRRMEHYDILNRLKVYTAFLVILSFFIKNAALFEELLPLLFMYMILSLMILAFYNMEQVGSALPEHYAGSMRKRWIWLAAAISILLTAVTGLIFSVYNPLYPQNIFNALKRFYDPFVNILIKILTPVVAPIIYVLVFIVNLIKRFAGYQEPNSAEAVPGPQDSLFAHVQYNDLPPSVTAFLKALVLIAVIAGFVAVLSMALKKWLSNKAEDVEETRESVFEWKNVRKNIMESMRRLTHTRRARKGTVGFSDTPAFRVRKLYVALLRKVKQKGCVREPSQTPKEFAPCITDAYGEECGALIRSITEAYIRARYYPLSVTKEDEEKARNCLADFAKKA